jgi:hypothetical protein
MCYSFWRIDNAISAISLPKDGLLVDDVQFVGFVEQKLHEDGLRVGLFAEISIDVSGDEFVELFVGHSVEFGEVSDLSEQALGVVLGVAVEEGVVVGLGSIVVGAGTELLLSEVAAHGPEFVVVAGALPGREFVLFNQFLPASDNAFGGVHGQQVLAIGFGPFMVGHVAGLEDFLYVGVGGQHELDVKFQPFLDELRVLFRGYEVILVGEVPVGFGVEGAVDLPVEGGAVVGVPVHDYFGEVAVAVEDVLAGVTANVDQPIQVLEREEGGVHVDAAVFCHDGQTVEVALGLRVGQHFVVGQRVLYLGEGLFVDVVAQVGVVDLVYCEI